MARRTRAQIRSLKDALRQILEPVRPATVRQVFYLASTRGLVDKTEAGYRAVGRLLLQLRRSGEVPFGWIADSTRWVRKPRSYSSLEDALASCARTYRRNLWDEQDASVEIWCEKDALAGVLYQETHLWDVPLMVCRGFSSATFLYAAARAIEEQGKPAFLYYFGDHDPSGLVVDRSVEKGLREYAPGAAIHFERVAVLPWQVERWDLPTRPTKKKDPRSKAFQGESVEVDAIPPDRLRALVRGCIERHVDQHAWEVEQLVEQREREVLYRLLRHPEVNGTPAG